jgi:serine/threonine protein kinase
MTTISGSPLRLGGVSEVADELGVTRQQVSKLRARPDFPSPVASLTLGEVWDLDAIRNWSASGLRRGAGRPAAASPHPVVLGHRFQLEDPLGGGGFAIVYRARDLSTGDGTRVAVKVLQEAPALDPETVARFQRELRLLTGLDDPHVMPVIASGTDDRLGLWYAMPLAQGSLADVVSSIQGTTELIVGTMRHVCAGLAYIHSRGVLHRDLKPENVLRARPGSWALADFGLARAVAETSVGLTVTADAMGTAFYTAPEQWKDAKRVDRRADIYSAGKVLQALVTGSKPVDDDIPPGVLRPVIRKAISQDPRSRYATAVELLTAIEDAVATPVLPGRWETPEEKKNRLRARLGGPRTVDESALRELVEWAETADPNDYTAMGELATTMSFLSADSVRWWWARDHHAFTRVFEAFADRLRGGFRFEDCDALANFARYAVTVTGDGIILRETVRSLALLGTRHNRWYVRDVTVSILQKVRTDEDVVAALEGLRAAGQDAVQWTVGDTALHSLHPRLRAGIASFLDLDGS